MALAEFQYSPLGDSRSSRFIKLLPATVEEYFPAIEDVIHFELIEFSLDLDTKYEALSYTWDDQEPTQEVVCNGKSLLVTENVYLALRRLRSYKGECRNLWIDAVSINQTDEEEKRVQVSNMGEIYTRAKRVNIWLSQSTSAMRAAFKYLRLTPDARLDREMANGIYELYVHPYWSRIWTVQEVALNDHRWLYLAQNRPMRLREFLIRLGDALDRDERHALPRDGEVKRAATERQRRRGPHAAITLHNMSQPFGPVDADMLSHLVYKRASIPHDLIFACKALFPETLGRIEVDYRRDFSDLLREASANIIPRLRDLGAFLCLVSLLPAVVGAPSWAFNVQSDTYVHAGDEYPGPWQARDAVSAARGANTAYVLPDGKTLCVRGLVADRISHVSDEFPRYAPGECEAWHRDVRALLRAWKALVGHALTPSFGEAVTNILFSALHAEHHEIDRGEKYLALRVTSERLLVSFETWIDGTDGSEPHFRMDSPSFLGTIESHNYFTATQSPVLSGHSLFATEKGRMGVGRGVALGDAVALMVGCELPFALRPVLHTSKYTLVQPVILDGVMLGGKWPGDHELGLQMIEII